MAALAVVVSACDIRPTRPPPRDSSLVTLGTIVWRPDRNLTDPPAVGDVPTLTVVVTETGRIESCTLRRSVGPSYECIGGLPPIPITPDGPDNVITVGWGSGETGYGIVLNGQRVDRVSERFDGLSQGHFRILDAAGHIQ
jgi:hypothetical protein